MKKVTRQWLLPLWQRPAMFIGLWAFALLPQFALSQGAFVRSGTTGNSNFLLTSNSATKNQSVWEGSEFTPALPTGNITRVYVQYGTTALGVPITLTDLKIVMGMTSITAFNPTTTFLPLTDTVFRGTVVLPAGAAEEWVPIDLQTPFAYTAGQNLIVEFQRASSSNTSFNISHGSHSDWS